MDTQNNFIKVFDNILSKNLEDDLEYKSLSDTIPWYFLKDISGVQSNVPLYGFSHIFYNKEYNIQSEEMFYFLQPLYQLLAKTPLVLQEIYAARLFLQLANPNPRTAHEGIHVDLEIPHMVCIYYINDAEGDTVFFDNDNNEIKRVSPKKGRMALFSGDIKHTGSTPSTLRNIINYNFLAHQK